MNLDTARRQRVLDWASQRVGRSREVAGDGRREFDRAARNRVTWPVYPGSMQTLCVL
ncbi:MAG: hypothetical protein WDZ49_01450 [Litorilinea sp.]